MFPCLTRKGCPETNNPKSGKFCPCWVEGTVWERSLETGEATPVRGCYFQVSIKMIAAAAVAQNQPAAEISALRQDLVRATERTIVALSVADQIKMIVDSDQKPAS